MHTAAILLYSVSVAALIALIQMFYARQDKVDLLIMAGTCVLCLSGGVAAHTLLTEA
ncbi:hypothetical protein HQ393_11405 [Chitinibacter bivalviorum]|uniref:Uncharacterized protein n=2 Tax=Chitinibacter bivalviorum TaxID=2739434 RepID=A0A7H9BKJ9_9NEIS|nr:hypothetical protein HQ393_11405 [Chitinibacter bivalviorum]